jgi:hypothetical protein
MLRLDTNSLYTRIYVIRKCVVVYTERSENCSQYKGYMYVYSRGGPHTALAPRPSLIYCVQRV